MGEPAVLVCERGGDHFSAGSANKTIDVCTSRAVFPNPVPGGTPTLRVFFVSLKHTRFNPSAH